MSPRSQAARLGGLAATQGEKNKYGNRSEIGPDKVKSKIRIAWQTRPADTEHTPRANDKVG